MKNHLLHLIALLSVFSFIFMSCKKDEKPITWPTSLGNASFASNKTWTISNDTITQVWSDAVQTDYCSKKTTFAGWKLEGDSVGYNIDCRSNPGQKGDLFSWQAVYELRDELCPAPWRVPTRQDFIDLDIAMGGTGGEQGNPTHRDKYLKTWGGTHSGYCNPGGAILVDIGEAFY
ncbi:MAG: hypothetical protein LBH22_06730 [Bacteroidales bacterium]|jgi:hypothetical protein|nr:hypothetical protein [Bacteroidales bacterium]